MIADIGDALFAATELVIRGRTEFISPAYYTSMGFSVPAALGAQVARPDLRTVVLVGDGAFQMTGMELSTIVRHGYPADRDRARQQRLRHRATSCTRAIRSTTSIPGPITSCPKCSAAARATKSAPKASSTPRSRKPGPTKADSA